MKRPHLIFIFPIFALSLGCSSPAKEKQSPKQQPPATQPATPPVPSSEPPEAKIIESISTEDNTTTCTMREDIRTLVFDKVKNNKGCQVQYTKFDKTYTIAHSENGVNYCAKIANRVLSNLQAAGFSCQAQAKIKPQSISSEDAESKQ